MKEIWPSPAKEKMKCHLANGIYIVMLTDKSPYKKLIVFNFVKYFCSPNK